MEFLVTGGLLGQDGPCPALEASTSTINCLSGSGTWRIGPEVNQVLRSRKAFSAEVDHWNGTLEDVRTVSGAAKVL